MNKVFLNLLVVTSGFLFVTQANAELLKCSRGSELVTQVSLHNGNELIREAKRKKGLTAEEIKDLEQIAGSCKRQLVVLQIPQRNSMRIERFVGCTDSYSVAGDGIEYHLKENQIFTQACLKISDNYYVNFVEVTTRETE